ncbi:S-layer family protein [Prolixibacter sp. NT017]|uniref:beta strand repeat-containing protein n=1 Tax=Prolixibacter sp. NT017 TaxID=2652390 RepID=UPI00127BDA87|nr:VCBS domain-containing protein [Prolixibacter sp. NT017]GET24068.1 hypothetical protein NT017_03970 [Prolixibacter sp. NT017]
MKKIPILKLFFLLIALFFLQNAGAQTTLSSSPTLTFSSTAGLSDYIAQDGDGGSTPISDIDIQIFNISDVNGTMQSALSWENNSWLASANSSFSALTNPNNSGSKGMDIKSADGSEFRLMKFDYYNWGESNPFTNTIKGYRNGSEVASTTFQGFDASYNPITVTLGSAFENVDEVRFYISAGGYLGDQSATNHSINNIQVSSAVTPSPTISNATYDASTGILAVTGTNMTSGDVIDPTKLTLTGQGGATYTLTGSVSAVTASGSTSFSVGLNASDQLAINGILNRNGTYSVDNTTYNLAGASGWDATAASPADVTGNGITVSNVMSPTITSATYNASTHVLAVAGTNLVRVPGAANDITVNKLTVIGENNGNYTLTSSDVEITDATSFSVTLNGADQSGVAGLLNNNGTSSLDGTNYDLAAADDWNSNVTGGDISDLTGNQITVSGVNTTPVLSNLDGDSNAWGGVGNTVALDALGDATASDAEFDALNGGNGDWAGGSLSVQRAGTAISSDVFGFDTSGALFTVSGSDLQSGGLTFATFTNTGGVLTISFTSSGTSATTALVQDVIRHTDYRNDTPAGDATLRFSLSDGNTSATADVTVTSNTIYVTNSTDATSIDVSNGVSLSEAVAIAAADNTGSQTIVFGSSLASQTIALAGNLSINESLTVNTGNAGGVSINSNTITLGSGDVLTWSGSSSATVNSTLSGSGNLSKTGSGTLTLSSGSNNAGWSGAISVTGGTLSAGVSAPGSLPSGNLTLDGGTLQCTVTGTAGTTRTIANNVVLGANGGTMSIGGGGGANITDFTGVISGTGNLTKTGAAILRLNGSNTFAGTTTVFAGTLSVAGDSNLGTGTLTLDNASTLAVTGPTTIDNSIALNGTSTIDNSAAVTLSGIITGANNLVKSGPGTLTLSGTNTYSGTTTVDAGTLSVSSDSNLGNGALTLSSGTNLALTGATTVDNAVVLSGNATVNTSANATLSGVISGTGNLTKTGTGTLTLSGSNTYSGTTSTSAGILQVASDSNLGTGAVNLAGSTLAVSGATTIDNAVNLSGSSTVRASADATLSGVVSGSGSLTKQGSASLTLSNTDTYTGSTTISAGTLMVTGALSGTASLTVGNTATLAGDGSVFGSGTPTLTVQSGGTLAPGNSVGTLTVNGNLNVSSGGMLVIDINGNTAGTGYDQVAVSGTVDVTGATISVAHNYSAGKSVSYTIINNDGSDAITGTFANLAEGATLTSGGNGTVLKASYVGGDGNDLTLTTPANVAPVVSNLNGDNASFTEKGSAVALDTGTAANVSDADNTNFSGGNVTVSLVTNRVASEDVLAIANQGTGAGQIGVSGSSVTYGGATIGTFTGGSGTNDLVISLSANATPTATSALLQALTYSNSNTTTPDNSTRTARVTVNDGDGGTSGNADVSIGITAVNDAPTSSTTGATASFTEGGSAVALFSGTTSSTVESGQNITGFVVGMTHADGTTDETLTIDGTSIVVVDGNSGTTGGNGLSYVVTQVGGADHPATVTLSGGNLSTAQFDAVIDGIKWLSTSNDPTAYGYNYRSFYVGSVKDNGGTANGGSDTQSSNTGTASVTITAVNNAPVVTTSSTALDFTEGDAASVIDAGITVSDVDNATLASATVSVSGNFASDEDVLAFANDGSTMGNISASYNSSTGVLTMASSGSTATLAQWQTALRAVSYANSSNNPSTSPRTISFIVSDGTDDSTPVTQTVHVTAVNDPPVVSGTFAGSVTEGNIGDSPVTATGTLSISDVDAATSPSFADEASTVGDNGYGSFVLASGNWTYTLDESKVQSLAAGATVTDTHTYTATDGTTQQITITITGTDDPPVLAGTFTGSVTEGNTGDSPVTATGTLSISDVDAATSPSFADEASTVGDNGYGSFVLVSGTWTYTLDESKVQSLAAGATVTDTHTYTATDGTTQQITITITGTDDPPVVSGTFAGSVTEGNIGDSPVTATGTLSISDVDAATSPSFADEASTVGDNGYGSFVLASGTWTYTLDESKVQSLAAGATVTDRHTYTATDGTTQQITITITGTDDPPVVSGTFAGSVTEGNIGDSPVTATGTLSISDVDAATSPSFADEASTVGDNGYGSFVLASGTWTYTLDESKVQSLAAGATVTDRHTYTATDGTTQQITITITGTDDPPVLAGTFTGSVTEGNIGDSPVTATGTLSISDVDAATSPSFADEASTVGDNGYGSFVLASGTWTYTLDESKVQSLAAGATVTDTHTFTATDGTTQQVTITITGTDDPPAMDLFQEAEALAADGTFDFGTQTVNTSTDTTFTIENNGIGTLTLTTPISLSGADASDFEIIQQPESMVAASSSTTFVVRFAPSSIGTKTAAISIENNDPNKNPYVVNLQATVVTATGVDDHSVEKLVKVYPTATHDKVHVQLANTEFDVALYSLQGVQLKQWNGVTDNVTLNLGAYHQGMYILRIKADHKVVTRRVIRR